MTEMSEDERVVRGAWEVVDDDSMRLRLVIVTREVGNAFRVFEGRDRWSAARKFTDEHREEVRKLEEEITEVRFVSRNFGEERGECWSRILSRLESALAEAKKGMKQ